MLKSLDEYVDHTYYINLDFRKDRDEQIQQELKKMNIGNYTRFNAVCPDEEIMKEHPNFMKSKPASYRKGALGCLLSHVGVIKDAKEKGYGRILILEDDCIFKTTDLTTLTNALKQLEDKKVDYDLLYLAANHITPPMRFTNNLVICRKGYTTSSYILPSSMYDAIIKGLENYNEEIDVYYHKFLQSRGKCFCLKPHLTRQRDGYSDIMCVKRNNLLVDPR